MPFPVRQFRQILIWPLQLKRLPRDCPHGTYWDTLAANPGPWQQVADNILLEDESCQAGYEEFVYFLPYVQRFLYGVGEANSRGVSSIHAFTRDDISRVEVELKEGDAPVHLSVVATRLYFFYDIDIAIVTFEVDAKDLRLKSAIDLIDRFGRPYPPAWDEDGRGNHCPHRVRFYDQQNALMATSDYGDREKYLELVKDIKQTPLSLHWEALLKPLVPAYLGGGTISFYQIENKRIPVMTYIALDDPKAIDYGDMVRLGSAAKSGAPGSLPYSKKFLEHFDEEHCYDRYWDPEDDNMSTRYMFSGVTFTMLTKAHERPELLRNFRHQIFQIALIAHFHKAALLNLSNRFSIAVERLRKGSSNGANASSSGVKVGGDFQMTSEFRYAARYTMESFLRFNHRYWFLEISHQIQARDFFQRFTTQLENDRLFREVRDEAQDINQYLDADRARKQADNAMRLTVVSVLGMVGTTVTGFLGMNVFEHHTLSGLQKFFAFSMVAIPTMILAVATVAFSKRLANYFEVLASERLTRWEKFKAFPAVFKRYVPGERDSGRN
jgi:hypothetical protein